MLSTLVMPIKVYFSNLSEGKLFFVNEENDRTLTMIFSPNDFLCSYDITLALFSAGIRCEELRDMFMFFGDFSCDFKDYRDFGITSGGVIPGEFDVSFSADIFFHHFFSQFKDRPFKSSCGIMPRSKFDYGEYKRKYDRMCVFWAYLLKK